MWARPQSSLLVADYDRYEDLIVNFLSKNDPGNREKTRDKIAKREPRVDRSRGKVKVDRRGKV
jgi:hypothetical protein